jgi:hypothetical protein
MVEELESGAESPWQGVIEAKGAARRNCGDSGLAPGHDSAGRARRGGAEETYVR